jgi:hypothetical protein
VSTGAARSTGSRFGAATIGGSADFAIFAACCSDPRFRAKLHAPPTTIRSRRHRNENHARRRKTGVANCFQGL